MTHIPAKTICNVVCKPIDAICTRSKGLTVYDTRKYNVVRIHTSMLLHQSHLTNQHFEIYQKNVLRKRLGSSASTRVEFAIIMHLQFTCSLVHAWVVHVAVWSCLAESEFLDKC